MAQRLRLAAEATGRVAAGLRSIVYGGGPMYVVELKKSIATFGQVFVQIYGQGESPMTTTWLRREDHRSGEDAILGSVGLPRTGVETRVEDPRGHVVLRDRSKDVVISGGSNIHPCEVEEILLTHPDVAFVVPAPGALMREQVLDAHCLAHIARFKRPKRYVFTEALPKNSYGKVLKRTLREQLARTRSAG